MPTQETTSTLTEILAIIGAVTGVGSVSVQMFSAVRDRPRLRIDMGYVDAVGRAPEAWIDVHNEGARPTTIREVGFFAGTLDFATQRETVGSGDFKTPLSPEPLFLESGRSVRARGYPLAVDAGFPADFPLRAYAIDQRGRYRWGSAAAVTRWLVGASPPFEGESEEYRRLFDDLRDDLKPARVESRWKLWKKKELRRPRSWTPSDGPRTYNFQFKRSGSGSPRGE